MAEVRLAGAYARFRGSAWFVVLLCLFLAGWLIAKWIFPSFDPQFGALNIILSSEASLSVALLIMANDRNDAVQRKQLEFLLHLLEANHAALVGQRESHATAASVDCMGSSNGQS